MKFTIQKNIILKNPETKPFLADTFVPENREKLPLVIFCHGYKGYKDWGAWNLMAEKFAENGFFFVKFNFSHNGTTLEKPSDFADLESFGENNYSKELSDLEFVLDYFSQDSRVDAENISLIGHSRGGGIAIIKATENIKIKNLITLASVDSLDRFPKGEDFINWKKEGVYFSNNARTRQMMPHYFQFFEDFEKNKSRFDVENSMKNFSGRTLIIHGNLDEAVDYSSAENLHIWAKNSTLKLIEGANHTFGAKEPWAEKKLPEFLEIVVKDCLEFLETNH